MTGFNLFAENFQGIILTMEGVNFIDIEGADKISALVVLLIEWVLEDMLESPETMDQRYQSLAEPTLERLLEV